MAAKTKCIFCGSPNFGKGCPYAPDRLHIHVGEPGKCIFCGSTNLGAGCPYSPTRRHIRGIPYNIYMKDSVDTLSEQEKYIIKETLVESIIKQRLFTEFEDTPAYDLKIIDKDGNKLKTPETLEEKVAYTPIDSFITTIKRMLGNKIELLRISSDILSNRQTVNESVEHFEKKERNYHKINNSIKTLFEEIEKAKEEGLTFNDIEEILSRSL